MVNIGRSTIISVIVLCMLALAYAAPNLFDERTFEDFPAWAPSKQINLGLDLQGGSYLLLEVDTDGVIAERLQSIRNSLRDDLRRHRGGQIFFQQGSLRVSRNAVFVTPRDADRREDALQVARDVAESESPGQGPLFQSGPTISVSEEGDAIVLSPSEDMISEWRRLTVEQSIEVVRRRVDELGTNEPVIQRQGDSRIIVAVPGVDDPERLKDILGKTAKLTFRFVNEEADSTARRAPANHLRLPSAQRTATDEPVRHYIVERRIMVSGDRLVDSQPTFQDNQPVVSFRFDGVGARQFADATVENVGRLFAIVLDDEVVSAPVIREAILGGSGIISGSFTAQTANDLALVLRAGALPAELTILEERTVGPGLGQDSIEAGEIAGIVGLGLVVIFMLLAYGPTFGGFVVIALIFNIAAIVALLSALQATLTLPGIAGIVLTIGMAVDANVLIFERIREEVALGRSPIHAVDAGYRRALSTIVDSNLTTAIAATMLFAFGAGPVRGFAVTLLIGIITTLFTAIMVTRLMVVGYLRLGRRKTAALPL